MRKLHIFNLFAAIALTVSPAYAGGELFLESTIAFDQGARTITLPLYKGSVAGGDVYYIITEASDLDTAEALGVNYSPKLANALGTAAVQEATKSGETVTFPGGVDFTPEHVVIPGPSGFPPEVAMPGSIGDDKYSPLATTGDGVVFNAPHVANSTGLHDSVVSIDPAAMTVVMALVDGFYHGSEILYISTDVSDFATAALEESTFAPNMNAAPGVASGDPRTSARSAIVPFINGQSGAGNPERQGLMSALLGEGPPLNVTEIHPRNRGKIPSYSPLWDVHPALWTNEAIAAGERVIIDHHDDIVDGVEEGFIASGGMGPMNPALGGLRAAGFIVNCPVMWMD